MPSTPDRARRAASWIIAVAAAFLLQAALLRGAPLRHDVAYFEVLGEGTFLALMIGWGWTLTMRRMPREVGVIALPAVWLLVVGAGLDLLDDVLLTERAAPLVVGSLSMAIGGTLASLAMWRWHQHQRRRQQQLNANNELLAKERYRDALTGLLNRAALDEHLAEARRPVALVLIDIDDFKQHNDTWGHLEGDRVIRELAETLKLVLRDTDLAFRYGGEEFAVMLPGAEETIARRVGERIRATFAERVFQPEAAVRIQKTVSIGLAGLRVGESDVSWLHRADQAMYRAKRAGKNCVATGREVFPHREGHSGRSMRSGRTRESKSEPVR